MALDLASPHFDDEFYSKMREVTPDDSDQLPDMKIYDKLVVIQTKPRLTCPSPSSRYENYGSLRNRP